MLRCKFLVVATMVLTGSAAYAGNSRVDADRQTASRACSNELSAAHCSADMAQPGARKCLNRYRQKHAEFKLSPTCESALQQLDSDIRELPSAN